jgi:hypothetical protein
MVARRSWRFNPSDRQHTSRSEDGPAKSSKVLATQMGKRVAVRLGSCPICDAHWLLTEVCTILFARDAEQSERRAGFVNFENGSNSRFATMGRAGHAMVFEASIGNCGVSLIAFPDCCQIPLTLQNGALIVKQALE